MKHDVAKVTARRTKRGVVHKVTCTCGVVFPSISSEAMALSYQAGHRRLMRKGSA